MNWEQVFATRAARMKTSEIREMLKLLDQPDIISFAGGIPDPALLPAEEFQKAISGILSSEQKQMALQYSISEGMPTLREWIVKEMKRHGVECTKDNIMVTSGSQQALDYLGKLLLSPNDTALVCRPTYLGALGAFNSYEAQYDHLLVNRNRSADDYRKAAEEKGGQVKFAYLSVDFANPTGETLDRRAREDVIALAEELEIAIIEDAAYQSLRYDGEVIPPILSLEIEQKGSIEDTRTMYCGSFSKTLSPGLRMGWICANSAVIEKLVTMKQASDLHSATLNQLAVAEVAANSFDTHVAKLHKAYSARRDRMLEAMDKYLPDQVEWTKPEGGMFIWITLPTGLDAKDVFTKSLETEKVAFVPGASFFADGSGTNTMRLSFSNTSEDMIEEGIKRLGRVLQAMV